MSPSFSWAQTFTAGLTGSLDQVDLLVRRNAGGGGSWVVEISDVDANGSPGSTLLASSSLPIEEIPSGPAWVAFQFTTPADVVAGVKYAIVVRNVNAPVGGWDADTRNPYGRGEMYLQAPVNGPWSISANRDAVFKTYVTPGIEKCHERQPTITGTPGKDTLTGTAGPDVIDGLGGNDTIRSRGGEDVVCGGDGDDRVYGDSGDDTIDGGEGDDVLNGGAGNDSLEGGQGDDFVAGSGGSDELSGGDGADTVNGGWGDDTLRGGDGVDRLYGSVGIDHLFGDSGTDYLHGGFGDDECADDGADQLVSCRDLGAGG